MQKKKIIFLVGPTASGKSEIAINLARKINAEIISCDSMQVYKDMDIGTSKPPRRIRRQITHYLIDIVKPNQQFNVAIFYKKAIAAIRKVHNKNKIPLVVGGSGLYMKVLLDGIFEEPEKDNELRQKLDKQADQQGIDQLYEELKKHDPEAAGKIYPRDRRRIIRALEVYYNLGLPISEMQKKTEGIYNNYNIRIFGLMHERKELNERINERVDLMFDKGLVNEIKNLRERYKLSRNSQEALGYKEILKFLNGECSILEAKELIKRNTRRFAKRQMTWFKKEPRIKWIKAKDGQTSQGIADKIYWMIENEV